MDMIWNNITIGHNDLLIITIGFCFIINSKTIMFKLTRGINNSIFNTVGVLNHNNNHLTFLDLNNTSSSNNKNISDLVIIDFLNINNTIYFQY